MVAGSSAPRLMEDREELPASHQIWLSRPASRSAVIQAWGAGLDYLFDEAMRRSVGAPTDYAELRRTFYAADPTGPRDGPGPAPDDPTPSAEVLAEFTTRLAPYNLNSWHPRSLSYFTPPPLVMSIAGELLAQFTNQGVDVWHAGPIGAFVEEEVCATSPDTGRTASGSSPRVVSWPTSWR